MAVQSRTFFKRPEQTNYDNHLARLIVDNPLIPSGNITPNFIECVGIHSLTCRGVTYFYVNGSLDIVTIATNATGDVPATGVDVSND